jgi:hypothetical protein
VEATHKITACYFPKTKEVELTWEDLESGEIASLTTKVDNKTGNQISKVVMACVYHYAIVKEKK